MNQKRWIAQILAVVLLLTLLAACGTSSEDEATVQPTAAAGTAQPSETQAPAAEAPATEAPEVEITGAVIPVSELPEEYDVLYGMYDFETYIPLPLTEEGEVLTYWLTGQPFTAAMDIDYDELTYYRELEARTGVEIEFTVVPFFTAADTFNIMTASGDYNDLIGRVGNYYATGASGAIEDGVILSMNEIIASYMPNYAGWLELYPDYRRAVTSVDGDIYMAGSFRYEEGEHQNTSGMVLRKDWLDELGMDMPVTYDDYHDILTAFKTEYGSSGLWMDNLARNMHSVNAAGFYAFLDNSLVDPLLVFDGEVVYSPITDNYRDFLRLFNTWWNEGLIWPDFMSQERKDYPDSNLVVDGTIGVWSDDVGNFILYAEQYGEDVEVVGAAPPRQYEGQVLHTNYNASVVSTGGTSISTTCENVELAAKWMDYVFTYDGYILGNYGVEGEGLEFAEDGTPRYTELVVGSDSDLSVIQRMMLYSNYGTHGILYQFREYQNYTDAQWDTIALYNEDYDTEYTYPQGDLMTIEENETYGNLMTDIRTYNSECTIRFITGELSVEDDWDSYVETMESMGIYEALEIAQTAYDRYMSN